MFALSIVRVGVGALCLWHARELWLRGVGPAIVEDLAYRIAEAPDWYRSISDALVLRFPGVFAWLVFAGTLAAGIAYFVGAAVRPASVGLVLLMANVMLVGPRAQNDCAALVAVCAIACFIGEAGLRLGLDRWLPRWLTWSSGRPASSRSKAARPR